MKLNKAERVFWGVLTAGFSELTRTESDNYSTFELHQMKEELIKRGYTRAHYIGPDQIVELYRMKIDRNM